MLRKNTAGQFVHIAGVNVSTGAIVTGATWTMRRCLDGTFAAGGATITEDGTTGFYKVAFTQADTNGNNAGYFFTATNCVPVTLNAVMTAADPTDSIRFGLSALPNVAAGSTNGLIINGTNTGTVTLAALTCTGALTISDGLLISRSTGNSSAITATGSGTGSGAVFTSGNGATGDGVQMTAGSANGNGLAATKTGSGLAFKGATTDLTLAKTTNITGFNDIAAPTGFAAATFPTGTIANTTNITGGTITTVTNLTNAPTAGDLTAAMKTSVKTQAVDALNTDTYAEPAQGAPGATITLAAKIGFLYKAWRNKTLQTSTQYSLLNDDAVTVDHKATVADDGTTFSRNEIAAGP